MFPISRNLMAAAAILVMAAPALAQTPSGDVTFTSDSVAAGSEFRKVDGTLHFKDKSYPFTVTGVRVASLGGERSGQRSSGAGDVFNQGTGEVYNLQRIEDFAGNFAPVKPGATIASEATKIVVENQKGVRLEVHTSAPETRIIEWPADGVVFALK
jgi:hypothetical protein